MRGGNMKFLIIGTGGTGGAIGGFLAAGGYDVTFIARGNHLEHIKKNGLKVKSGIKGDIVLQGVKSSTGEDYSEKADVIFVCVKGYSMEDIIPIVKKAAHRNTVVIPIMNGIGIGDKIYDKFKEAFVSDGCVYMSGYMASYGEVVQLGKVFKIVFGARRRQPVSIDKLEAVKSALCSSGIEAVISEDIQRDTFKKFSFISAFATCGVYYNAPAGDIQKNAEYRQMFISLVEEIKAVAEAMKIYFNEDIVAANLKVMDSMTPDTTSSLHKDIKAGKQNEVDSLIFEVVRLADIYGVEVPNYKRIYKCKNTF
jgi:2-dehydropantoate 2-reductase